MTDNLKAQLLDPAYRAKLLEIEANPSEAYLAGNPPTASGYGTAREMQAMERKAHFAAALELIGELLELSKAGITFTIAQEKASNP